MQIGSANDTTQVPSGKTVNSASSPRAKSGFPADLLSALSFTPQKNPPGPEPPFPSTSKVGVEEAAKAPNVPSQKLDSPHRNQKGKTAQSTPTQAQAQPTISPIPQLGLAAIEKNDAKAEVAKADTRVAQAIESAKTAPKTVSQPEKEKPVASPAKGTPAPNTQAEAKALPKDESAPIVSVKRIVETGASDQNTGAKPSAPKVDPTAPKTEVGSVQGATSGAKGGFASFGQSSGQSKGGNRSNPDQTEAIASVAPKASGTASIDKPVELTASQNLDRHALVRQVADKLQALAAARSQEGVVVQLAPKALGSVTLTIKSMGAGVEAHIAASDDQVRKALEQSRPDLIQAMQNRGYQVSQVTVSTQTATTTDGSRQQQPQFRSQPQSQTATANDSSAPVPSQTPDLSGLRPINPSGVDISI